MKLKVLTAVAVVASIAKFVAPPAADNSFAPFTVITAVAFGSTLIAFMVTALAAASTETLPPVAVTPTALAAAVAPMVKAFVPDKIVAVALVL